MKKYQIINNCTIGKGTVVHSFVNLYDCSIGDNCIIGTFVEIQKGVKIGDNVKIQSHSFICEGVEVEENAFIGHHVVFINDKYPHSVNTSGKLQTKKDWKLLQTIVKKNASIGSNATILSGIIIGENAMVGAGSVVTNDVTSDTVVVGNPARILRKK